MNERLILGMCCIATFLTPAFAVLPARPPEVYTCLRFEPSTVQLSADSQATLASYLQLARPRPGQGSAPEYEVLRVVYPTWSTRETLLAELKLASERQVALTKALSPDAQTPKFLTEIMRQGSGEKCDATIRSTYSFESAPALCGAAPAVKCRIECTSSSCAFR
jgi:hypothetical protein